MSARSLFASGIFGAVALLTTIASTSGDAIPGPKLSSSFAMMYLLPGKWLEMYSFRCVTLTS